MSQETGVLLFVFILMENIASLVLKRVICTSDGLSVVHLSHTIGIVF